MSFQSLFTKKSLLRSFVFLFCCFTVYLSFFSRSVQAQVVIGWQDFVDPTKSAHVGNNYPKAIGDKVKWQHYDRDTELFNDLSDKKVQFGTIESTSLVSAATVGLQVRAIAVAAIIRESSALVVSLNSQITKPEDLIGKKIATPFVSNAHYSLLRALQHWNIPLSDVHIVNLQPEDILKAWKKGTIDGAYVSDITLLKLKETGKVLVDSGQVADWGFPTYRLWVTMDQNISTDPYTPQYLVDTTLKIYKDYRKNKASWNATSPAVTEIAKLMHISPNDAVTLLSGSTYPDLRDQKQLLTGPFVSYLGEVALFLKNQNVMGNVLSDYLLYVDTNFVDPAYFR